MSVLDGNVLVNIKRSFEVPRRLLKFPSEDRAIFFHLDFKDNVQRSLIQMSLVAEKS
jgi:hypothetical protein